MSAATALSRPASGSEKRQHPRFDCGRGTVGLLSLDGQLTVRPVEVRNLSRGGACLVVEQRVELEKTVVLALRGPRAGFIWRGRARVVYILNRPDGRHVLGCAFLRELTDDDVRQLV